MRITLPKYPMEQNTSDLKYPVDVVLDTDTFNEVDDQFALAYMLSLQDKLHVRAITAAPFHNQRSTGPEDGMVKSLGEIRRLLKMMEREDMLPFVFEGARSYLPDDHTPADSPAAREIVRLAKEHSPEDPLYLIGIACATNIASAFLLCPEIQKNTVVVWLAGHDMGWMNAADFNIRQDYFASRYLFDSDCRLVELPCDSVVSRMTITGPEIDAYFRGKNALCDYLCGRVVDEVRTYTQDPIWDRVIWDVTAVCWFLGKGMWSRTQERHRIGFDGYWEEEGNGKEMQFVWYLDRSVLWRDIVEKLTGSMWKRRKDL